MAATHHHRSTVGGSSSFLSRWRNGSFHILESLFVGVWLLAVTMEWCASWWNAPSTSQLLLWSAPLVPPALDAASDPSRLLSLADQLAYSQHTLHKKPLHIPCSSAPPVTIDRIYYINLPHHTGRRALMESWLSNATRNPVPYARVSALRGLPNSTCVPEKSHPDRCAGIAGLARTELNIFSEYNTTGTTLVLEDDHVVHNMTQLIQSLERVPSDWEMVRWNCWAAWKIQKYTSVNDVVYATDYDRFCDKYRYHEDSLAECYCGGTGAYLVRDTAIPKLQQLWGRQPFDDIDCRLTTSPSVLKSYCINVEGLVELVEFKGDEETGIPKVDVNGVDKAKVQAENRMQMRAARRQQRQAAAMNAPGRAGSAAREDANVAMAHGPANVAVDVSSTTTVEEAAPVAEAPQTGVDPLVQAPAATEAKPTTPNEPPSVPLPPPPAVVIADSSAGGAAQPLDPTSIAQLLRTVQEEAQNPAATSPLPESIPVEKTPGDTAQQAAFIPEDGSPLVEPAVAEAAPTESEYAQLLSRKASWALPPKVLQAAKEAVGEETLRMDVGNPSAGVGPSQTKDRRTDGSITSKNQMLSPRQQRQLEQMRARRQRFTERLARARLQRDSAAQ